jgi:hypothetical protein
MRVLRFIILGLGGRVVVVVTIIVGMTVLHVIVLWLFLMLLPYICYDGIHDIDHDVDAIIDYCDCIPQHQTQILKPKTQTPNPKPQTLHLNPQPRITNPNPQLQAEALLQQRAETHQSRRELGSRTSTSASHVITHASSPITHHPSPITHHSPMPPITPPPLPPLHHGARVRLEGLTGHPEYNGRTGIICAPFNQETERWMVSVEACDDAPAFETAVRSVNLKINTQPPRPPPPPPPVVVPKISDCTPPTSPPSPSPPLFHFFTKS